MQSLLSVSFKIDGIAGGEFSWHVLEDVQRKGEVSDKWSIWSEARDVLIPGM